ncbi:MAG: NAD(P)/FAD-dependent oxidoreductase, partial [Polyangiales bacterium]
RARVAKALATSEADLPVIALRKRSIDARKGKVRFHLLFELGAEQPSDLGTPHPRAVGPSRTVIVGDGPAGLFCAYELARRGLGCTVVDRGKPVQPRRHDLKRVNRMGEVDPDSNYCFGEGGAGTYSDGKLYTRAHKRGSVRDVIEILVRHGAPAAILTDARPHIGSNKLPAVVSSLRAELEAAGVEFRFGARVTGFTLRRSARPEIGGLLFADGSELPADRVVLATGHSASDVYEMLERHGVRLEPKAFALGVRIEHPQPLIDRIQYGTAAGHPALPAASYRVAETVGERGVFSFCMCPGGFIVPAATQPGGLVVNGMSLSRRSSRYANSGLVVAIEPADVIAAGFAGVRGGIALQHALEQAAFAAGGGGFRAPATRATDFVAGRGSSNVPASSYLPGLNAGNLAEVLDGVGLQLSDKMRRAVRAFDRRMHGYLSEEAVLVGVESRTSSPVRIPRDAETLQALDLGGLFPAGEGAGYAGGIMSAAMDGMRIARQIAAEVTA